MDWDFDGDEFDEEAKLREETLKIIELPHLPVSATCMRVPVLVGHAEAVWVETQHALSPEHATSLLEAAPGISQSRSRRPDRRRARMTCWSAASAATGHREGLCLLVVGDNLRKGAALNAIQIAELVLASSDDVGHRRTKQGFAAA